MIPLPVHLFNTPRTKCHAPHSLNKECHWSLQQHLQQQSSIKNRQMLMKFHSLLRTKTSRASSTNSVLHLDCCPELGIQTWRWPQPEVTLEKNYCKMNIVTKVSCFIYLFFYFLLLYLFIYLFIFTFQSSEFFCRFFFLSCFRRAPRSGFSSCWPIL